MKFYFIWTKLFGFGPKNANKIYIRIVDMGPKKAIKMINIYQITLEFKFQQYKNQTYIWKEKKNATILNLYNSLNLNVTCYTCFME